MGTTLPAEAGTGLGRTRQGLPAAPTASRYGLLRPEWRAGGRYDLRRIPPAPDLAQLIERHWVVEWDLRGHPDQSVETLPHPVANLFFWYGTGSLAGPGVRKSVQELSGRGRVFGVKLRAGAGYPLTGIPMRRLVDATRPLPEVFGVEGARLSAAVNAAEDDAEQVALAEEFLRSRLPTIAADPMADLVDGIVHRLLTGDRTLRVEDAARAAGLSMRSLQRLFERYVGVPPKQVLMRYRLHEAADRIAAGQVSDWAEFAAEMGYFDQAHFIREFTRTVGMPPVAYAHLTAADR
jgi:AraC-like DNA-binding protein